MKVINLLQNADKFLHGSSVFTESSGETYVGKFSKEEAAGFTGSCKSGGYILLTSNAPVLFIRIICSSYTSGNFPHIGISVQKGISVSFRIKGSRQWYNYDCFYGKNDKNEMKVDMYRHLKDEKSYELMIYLPHMCYVEQLELSVGDNDDVGQVIRDTSIAFLGGKNTFGVGAASSAFFLSNIYARKTESDVINISCSSNKYTEFLANLNKKLLRKVQESEYVFLECDNDDLSAEALERDLPVILSMILSADKPKIIMYNMPTAVMDKKMLSKREFIYSILRDIGEKYSERILFMDNYNIFTEELSDMYTYSKKFLNDNGFIWIYKESMRLLEENKWNI